MDTLFWDTLFRDGARWKYELVPEKGGEASRGLLALCSSPGKGMFGADGLRASDNLRASNSAAAISLRFLSARVTNGILGDTTSWKSLAVELGCPLEYPLDVCSWPKTLLLNCSGTDACCAQGSDVGPV